MIVASDTAYQLVLHGSAVEASVADGGAFSPPVVVNAGAEGDPPYYIAMTYDGTNLELYVNPAASDGKTNFLANENSGNGRYNVAQVALPAGDGRSAADRRECERRSAGRVLSRRDPERRGV